MDVAIYGWGLSDVGGGVDVLVVAIVARAELEIKSQSTYDSHDNGKQSYIFPNWHISYHNVTLSKISKFKFHSDKMYYFTIALGSFQISP